MGVIMFRCVSQHTRDSRFLENDTDRGAEADFGARENARRGWIRATANPSPRYYQIANRPNNFVRRRHEHSSSNQVRPSTNIRSYVLSGAGVV